MATIAFVRSLRGIHLRAGSSGKHSIWRIASEASHAEGMPLCSKRERHLLQAATEGPGTSPSEKCVPPGKLLLDRDDCHCVLIGLVGNDIGLLRLLHTNPSST